MACARWRTGAGGARRGGACRSERHAAHWSASAGRPEDMLREQRWNACASAGVTRQGRANTGSAAGSGRAAARHAGQRCAGRSREMQEKLQCGGCRRTCPGSSRVARGERRGSLRRKPRTKSSGIADCSRRIWRWPRCERASVLAVAEGASVARLNELD
jgi:hypothetical protein